MNITLSIKELEQLTQLKTGEIKHYENTIKQMKEAREQDRKVIDYLHEDIAELTEENEAVERRLRQTEFNLEEKQND